VEDLGDAPEYGEAIARLGEHARDLPDKTRRLIVHEGVQVLLVPDEARVGV